MKTLLVLFLVSVSTAAQADVLKCWNTYGRSRVPFITATIVSNSELTDLTVNPKSATGFATSLQAKVESVVGVEITTKRSPYVGNQEFHSNDFRIILPMSLANDDLLAAQQTGIGMGKGENGVAIGSWEGDGAGSHFSVRLRCRSYAK